MQNAIIFVLFLNTSGVRLAVYSIQCFATKLEMTLSPESEKGHQVSENTLESAFSVCLKQQSPNLEISPRNDSNSTK